MKVFGLCWIILLCLCCPALSQVRIVDGDTIELGDTTYRINGIDVY